MTRYSKRPTMHELACELINIAIANIIKVVFKEQPDDRSNARFPAL